MSGHVQVPERRRPYYLVVAISAVDSPLTLAARRHRLVTEVARQLDTRCAVPSGARVAVGVSGGPDSLALLLAVVAISGRPGRVDPVAVHVNHHLRDGADADQTHVAEVCSRLGVTLDVRHVRPDRRPGNVAANARDLRYEALAIAAASAGAHFVAVAHHAEDQLETMLIALGRGTGLDGLSAMSPSRPLSSDVTLVRPLLGVRKADCEDLCRVAGVTWRQDPTNFDPSSVRARLRRDVLPVLDELWPDAAIRAANTADVVDAARAALAQRVEALFGASSVRQWDRQRLAGVAVPIIAAGLRRAALSAEPNLDLGRAQLMPAARAVADDDRRPREFHWPDGLRLNVTAGEVRLSRAAGVS